MNCKQGTDHIIGQMTELLKRISPEHYSRPLALFNGSSIGQHFRHIFDFYNCLCNGVSDGTIDYTKRDRDPLVETDPAYAALVFFKMQQICNTLPETATIEIIADFSSALDVDRPVVKSTIARELMYAYDHAVHHLAMIKMGLNTACPDVEVDRYVGVAPSTVKHWHTTANNGR